MNVLGAVGVAQGNDARGGKRSCQKMNNDQNTFLVPLGPLCLSNGKY